MRTDAVDRMVREWADRAPRLDVTPLEVAGRLLLAAAHLEQAIVTALKPLGLSFGDFDVINTLRRRNDPRGTNPGDLARSSLITTGAMAARLDRLERNGLIRRRADPGDGRGVLVRLTKKGDRLAEQAVTLVLATDEAFLEPLSPPQRATVAAALRQVLTVSG